MVPAVVPAVVPVVVPAVVPAVVPVELTCGGARGMVPENGFN